MNKHTPLPPDQLYRRCDPATIPFSTTDEADELKQIIGQDRALEALRFGTGINREGFNLYVMGPAGVGKHTVIKQVLGDRIAGLEVPGDLCYVHNFARPHCPNALMVPPATGNRLRDEMAQLIETLRGSIPAAFESDEYRDKIQEIEGHIKQTEDEAFFSLQKRSLEQEVKLFRTPSGFTFAPLIDGKVIGPAEFQKLSQKERDRIEQTVAALQHELEDMLHQMEELKKDGRDRVRQLNREVTMFAVGSSINGLRERYSELPEVVAYLDTVQQDVIDNAQDFRSQEDGNPLFGLEENRPSFTRYQVNVLVSHDANNGAPLVYEDFPTYQNLLGRIEHRSHLGTLVTDFTLIKPGALHQANGGYLLVDARKILTEPFAWEGLKRSLQSRHITIMSPGQIYSMISTVSLEPEPVPLDVKVILIGDRILYYLLCELDPEFEELFKVAADFEEEMDWTPDNTALYARLIATLAQRDQLLPLERAGVARVIEESARRAEDSEKLSTHIRGIHDLLMESDYWARERDVAMIAAEDVDKAVVTGRHRVSRYHEKVLEEIQRGTILIDLVGDKTGQVNGLTVVLLGGHAFGQPSRITATVRLGEGEVVDIEREVELGGSIHSKGVMILSAYLSSTFGKDHPLSLAASLTFEQSYGQVDGDSASVAELCALLSAVARVPIRQSIAVTGSVNQLGQAQAIGGVNEKIEGYFEVCQRYGLSGDQGVIIPASNVCHLMLSQEVRDAVTAGQFHIYPMDTIDDAVEILTGLEAGRADKQGLFPEGSFNRQVHEGLHELAHTKIAYGEKIKEEEHKTEE